MRLGHHSVIIENEPMGCCHCLMGPSVSPLQVTQAHRLNAWHASLPVQPFLLLLKSPTLHKKQETKKQM